ncbi:MAG: DUF4920 domain-containing protein [Christiangramia sp.]|nr:DUF4920 domain-containing protein [Christiangramia sp.]
MRITILIVALFMVFPSCKERGSDNVSDLARLELNQQEYESFGEMISADNSLSAKEMKQQYEDLKPGDTIRAKFSSRVNSVCKMKGCWMVLELPGIDEDPMIKFKDYGFFVPKDIEGREVIVEGLAFIEEISIEDQQHFAKDARKSTKELEAIDKPKKSLGFLAHGVLLKK